jgi:hypothetical protein
MILVKADVKQEKLDKLKKILDLAATKTICHHYPFLILRLYDRKLDFNAQTR